MCEWRLVSNAVVSAHHMLHQCNMLGTKSTVKQCRTQQSLIATAMDADFTNRVEDMRLQDLAEGDSKELVSQVS